MYMTFNKTSALLNSAIVIGGSGNDTFLDGVVNANYLYAIGFSLSTSGSVIMSIGNADLILAKINPSSSSIMYVRSIGSISGNEKGLAIHASALYLHIVANEDFTTAKSRNFYLRTTYDGIFDCAELINNNLTLTDAMWNVTDYSSTLVSMTPDWGVYSLNLTTNANIVPAANIHSTGIFELSCFCVTQPSTWESVNGSAIQVSRKEFMLLTLKELDFCA